MLISDPTEPFADIAEILRFYADAGVDEALLEEPVNRFAEPTPARQMAQQMVQAKAAQQAGTNPAPIRPTAKAAVPDEEQVARAREISAKAQTLDELRDALMGFDGCNLKLTAKSLVYAGGSPNADLMIVGEAPGRDADVEGLPFSGRSGQLLDAMLAAIGIKREGGAYIANVVPWRPPGARNPTPLETEICRPFIERQIELANPKVLITLGGLPAKVLLHGNEAVLRLRGTWKVHKTASGLEIPAMPTLHPDYLLKNPAHKKLAWRDLLEVAAKLDELRG
jgi:uracil-DNA glycosylase family 4